MTANPGSPEAQAMGCKCPAMDNGRGHGYATNERGEPVFVVNGDCPIHGEEA